MNVWHISIAQVSDSIVCFGVTTRACTISSWITRVQIGILLNHVTYDSEVVWWVLEHIPYANEFCPLHLWDFTCCKIFCHFNSGPARHCISTVVCHFSSGPARGCISVVVCHFRLGPARSCISIVVCHFSSDPVRCYISTVVL